VVEPTESFGYPERRKEFVNPARFLDVNPDIAFSLEGVTGLRGTYERELRSAVFHTPCFTSRTGTNEGVVDLVEDFVRDIAKGTRRGTIVKSVSSVSPSDGGLRGRGRGLETLNDLVDHALILIPVTLFPSISNTLGEGVKGCRELLGPMCSEAEVIYVDLGRPNGGSLEAIGLEAFMEIHSGRASASGSASIVVSKWTVEVANGVVEESPATVDLT